LEPKLLKPKTTTDKPEHSMKPQIHLAALGLLSTVLMQSPALGQGSLTPPGAPAPTMKTLQQVEPRTPISSAPFTITEPGSYYLTTNLTVSSGNAITIATNGVTLDLNGYTIRCTANPASGTAILIYGDLRNLAILNGNIEGGVTNNAGTYDGPGFDYGIGYYYLSAAPRAVRVSGINVSGCRYDGVYLGNGDSTVVESCAVRTVGSYGIVASVVKNCTALECGSTAISGVTVSDCWGESTGSGHGVYAYATAQNCYGISSSGYGVYAERTAQNCRGISSRGTGVYAERTAQNCYGTSNGSGDGVSANTAQNCYGISNSGRGVYAFTALNCYGNSAGGDGVYAYATALNCYGISSSGRGVYANTAQNCYGYSPDGNGIYANRTAIGCYGESTGGTGVNTKNAVFCVGKRPGGNAILTVVANGCYVESGDGTIFATYKYNMP
jgi:hypothetical protein